jgi:L-ascorbate metabolism protein UlaG (beta-lactamase superfamily)
MRLMLLMLCACTARSTNIEEPASVGSPTPPPTAAAQPKAPLALTYLGVAGWQIESAGKTILIDPYFSRPKLDGPIASDAAAVAARSPKRADLIVVGHSHVDHLLDAPAVALATGADVLGSDSTARVARSLGVPANRIIPIKGGEDYAFDGYSVRVLPSLHSALDAKHMHELGGTITTVPPRVFDDWKEGGTFNYLVRVGGHTIFVSSTANFIERELEGLRPDIAIIATGLRQEIFDYTCRLLTVLGKPKLVYTTHFDNWRGPPVDEPPNEDLRAFVEEVHACSPATRVVIPKHFERMSL